MRDLGQYWGNHINHYAWRIDDELYDFFEEVLDGLGEYAKSGRRFLKNLERKSETEDDDED